MSEQRNPPGAVGQRVMANVRQLRLARGMTYRDLSAALSRPIPVIGLARLERGERRVDVDDLVALAQALGVSVDGLLFGEVAVTVEEGAGS